MVPAKETAEEQLLRMIEGPAGPPVSGGPWRRLAPARLVELARSGVGTLWRWTQPAQQARAASDMLLWRLRLAERVFWVVLGGLAVYLVVDLVAVKARVASLAPPDSSPPASAAATTGGPGTTPAGSAALRVPALRAENHLRALAEYREALVARNPFGLVAPASSGSAASPVVKDHLQELTGALTVVGINRGKVPEALIEDGEAQRTYFVKVGDEVKGLRVQSIDERGVTVSYEGEQALLR